MTKDQLLKYFPEQAKEHKEFEETPGSAFRSLQEVGSIIEEVAVSLQTALLRELGYAEGLAPEEPFKIEHLMSLPLEKKEKIESLMREMIGYCACEDYSWERGKN